MMDFGKRMIGGFSVVVLVMASMPAAGAGPWRSDRAENWRSDLQPERRGSGPGDGRGEHRRGEDREMRQRQHRLSPEERSQLRRDIRDAGREIYHGHR
ncbi:MAG: hypothetical protein LBI87_15445 [Candidatus Accumulibacter sp.]|jgi:hypothetical protein|nr:hypothetical protein [Accumulibacter sp.]